MPNKNGVKSTHMCGAHCKIYDNLNGTHLVDNSRRLAQKFSRIRLRPYGSAKRGSENCVQGAPATQ